MQHLQELSLTLFWILLFISPGIIYFFLYRKTRRKLPIEIDKTPIYQEICSLRINGQKFEYVRFSLYREFIVLMTALKNHTIPIKALKTVKLRHRGHTFYTLKELLEIRGDVQIELTIDPYDETQYPHIIFFDEGSPVEIYKKISPLIAEDNKRRQEILEALIILYKSSDIVETIKESSQNAKKVLIKQFGITPRQASAIMELKKPISQIPIKSILVEQKSLKKNAVELTQLES